LSVPSLVVGILILVFANRDDVVQWANP